MYTYTHTHIHTCIHPSTHPYIHTSIHPYIHTYIHTSIHPYMHTYIHTFIRTYIHTCMHTYIHTLYTYSITIIFLLCLHKWPSFPSVSLSPARRLGSSNLLEGLWPSSGSPSVQCLSPTLVLRRQNKLEMSGTSQAK